MEIKRYNIKSCSNPDCDAHLIEEENGVVIMYEDINKIHNCATQIIENFGSILTAHGCCENALTGI